jgi:hypothetical protein
VVLGASTPRGRLRVSAPVVIAHLAFGRIGARFALACTLLWSRHRNGD